DDECYNRIRLRNSLHRSQVLDAFVQHYNFRRPHLSLKGLTPVQRRINYFNSVTDVLE
ncbi:MAG: integrase core domain-containing protein, partial [Candidatus Omnitrophica bacterium]|nr:integrase core domain-containing protein [Candidatus Omnitrophota bacterium]